MLAVKTRWQSSSYSKIWKPSDSEYSHWTPTTNILLDHQHLPFRLQSTFKLTTALRVSRCGEEPWPECATGGWKQLSLSCGRTGATRWSHTSARSTGASRTLGPWKITAGAWSGPHPQKSCASSRRHSGASTAGSSSHLLPAHKRVIQKVDKLVEVMVLWPLKHSEKMPFNFG